MTPYKSLRDKLWQVNSSNFESFAVEVFRYQSQENAIYKEYINHLGVIPKNVKRIEDIPFLPISLFKKHKIVSGSWHEQAVFQSSGTTGTSTSKHYVKELQLYLTNARKTFNHFYGPHEKYYFLFLLPSYLERNNSSLVHMADDFIKASKSDQSGFYLSDYDKLVNVINRLKKRGDRKLILWGVTFALVELAERYDLSLENAIIMETGGMKGRRKELTRQALHEQLRRTFSCTEIHSEYGMTELFSQSYSLSGGYFLSPNWMQIILRDPNDPFHIGNHQRSGGVNVIDLANIHSCCFIETEDLGRQDDNLGFQILGRFDHSDVRGCNLIV